SGAVYVTGQSSAPPENSGNDDLFLVKYDQSGSVAWSKESMGTRAAGGTGIVVSRNGNVFVSGEVRSQSTMQLDSIEFTTALQSVLEFLLGYDSEGHLIAASEFFRSTDYQYDTNPRIALDERGNVYHSGAFYNPLTFGSTTLS